MDESVIHPFRTYPGILEAIQAEADKRGISLNAMINRIVKDWFDDTLPELQKPKEEKPWYLQQ